MLEILSVKYHSPRTGYHYCIVETMVMDGKPKMITYYQDPKNSSVFGMEIYQGANYIVGSTDPSWSRIFKQCKRIPSRYYRLLPELCRLFYIEFKVRPTVMCPVRFIRELIESSCQSAAKLGYTCKEDTIPKHLLWACGEISREAYDAYKKKDYDLFLEEIADAIITLAHVIGDMGWTLRFLNILTWKLEKNKTREHLHGFEQI